MKITVVSEQGREVVVAILGTNEFLVKDILPDRKSEYRLSRRSPDSVVMRLEKAVVIRVIHQSAR